MINTQLKFEAKIPNVKNVVAFTELHKIFKFQGQFDLEDIKVTSFQTNLRYLHDQ